MKIVHTPLTGQDVKASTGLGVGEICQQVQVKWRRLFLCHAQVSFRGKEKHSRSRCHLKGESMTLGPEVH